MIVSHEKKFIFLHIPKTAGTSVRSALMPYANPTETKMGARIIRTIFGKFTPHNYVNFRNHPHWTLIKAQEILPERIYSSYLKFCFVRHPVDWQHSVFRHILSHPHIPEFKSRFAFIYKKPNFEDYMKWRIDNIAIPQTVQLLDHKDEIGMDRVARFEFLNRDFTNITNELNISAKLPFLNSNKLKPSVEISDSMRSLIFKHYKIDFDLFGYTETGIDTNWTYNKKVEVKGLSDMKNVLGPNYDVWGLNSLVSIQP